MGRPLEESQQEGKEPQRFRGLAPEPDYLGPNPSSASLLTEEVGQLCEPFIPFSIKRGW